MNPAPCIAIEKLDYFGAIKVAYGHQLRTRAQIRKGLLRVWRPGEANYFLWISADIHWPGKDRNSGARWWQPPVS